MEKLGLVLAGGGGKGAYEIGVWQALRDLGLEPSVSAVSGTSVGALNAALFAAGDLTRARAVWQELSPTHIIFSPDRDRAEARIAQLLSPPGPGQRLRDFLHGSAAPSDPLPSSPASAGAAASPALFFLRSRLIPALSQLLTSGIISAGGLGEMIDGAVDCARLAASPVRCYATCLRIPRLRPDRFLLNDRSPEDVRAILLASAAIPFFFPMAAVAGRRYLDGGLPPWGDNVPVQPLYELEGCRTNSPAPAWWSCSPVRTWAARRAPLILPPRAPGGGWSWATGTVWSSWPASVSPNLNQTLIDLRRAQ